MSQDGVYVGALVINGLDDRLCGPVSLGVLMEMAAMLSVFTADRFRTSLKDVNTSTRSS